MGDLISFRPSRNAARVNDPPPPHGAQILFFTGVRYDRRIEAATALTSADEQDAPPKGGMDGTGGRRRKRRG